jgi:hypothetical protein
MDQTTIYKDVLQQIHEAICYHLMSQNIMGYYDYIMNDDYTQMAFGIKRVEPKKYEKPWILKSVVSSFGAPEREDYGKMVYEGFEHIPVFKLKRRQHLWRNAYHTAISSLAETESHRLKSFINYNAEREMG